MATLSSKVAPTGIVTQSNNLSDLANTSAALTNLGISNHDDITVDGSGNVGIGTSSPSTVLDVLGEATVTASNVEGISLIDGNTISASPWIYALGKRSDSNNSQSFGGKLLLAGHRTNAAVGNNKRLGTISFGGNHTDGSESNILATASISGVAEGTFYNSTTMPTALAFYTGSTGYTQNQPNVTFGTERMRITSSGNVFVGHDGSVTSNPGYYGGVNGSTIGRGYYSAYRNSPSVYLGRPTNGTVATFRFNGTSIVGSISITSSSTAYNTSSDYRLKEDWQPMSGSIDRVKQLKPVNFAWKVDGSRVDGFLAHEAQEVVPEAVTGTKDAMTTEEYEVTPAVLDDDGNVVTEAVMGEREVPDYQGIDQSKLVPLLTAALQEAIGRIEALESKLTTLSE